ncbi:MAG: hypothetical protein KFW21_02430 [Spirochaetota bacterium]|nr:hypothetical protein [Spirochaetota bacterium]
MGLLTSSFGTTTSFITDNKFNNLWLWQLSNTTVTQEKGISLSKETTKNFQTSQLLWTGVYINNSFYLGTAEESKILKIDRDFKETEIFSSSNHSIISSIVAENDGILFAASPESTLYHLNKNYSIVSNTSLSNSYVWDIVPNPKGGYYILTGLSATVYEYNNFTLSNPIIIDVEEHLLQGLYVNDTLWVLGEKALYKKQNDRFIAIALFEGTASGFTYTNNNFYIIHSVTQEENPATGQPEQIISKLTSISLSGAIETLYELNGFYFTSVGIFNNNIVIGADQFGLYIMYDIITKKSYYSGLGEGKILELFNVNNSLMLLSSDTSALWTMKNTISSTGSFTSEVYDAGNIASWGNFFTKVSTPPNTSIQFFVQSGVTTNPKYWEDWKEISANQKITTPMAQYIRYKAILKSDGIKMPYVEEVKFPYTQLNLKPSINNIDIELTEQNIIINWSASDPNDDTLEYDIYLAEDGLPKIKINQKKITSTNFTFAKNSYPTGYKKITLIVSDRPSNSDKTALTSDYTSIPIMFDSEAPIISNINLKKSTKSVEVSFSVSDTHSIIKETSYIINGSTTIKLVPIDGIFDSKKESFLFNIPLDTALFLQISTQDDSNNNTTKGVTLLPN